MDLSSRPMKIGVAGLALAGAVLAGRAILEGPTGPGRDARSTAGTAFNVPKLSSAAEKGKVAFDEKCAACHGANAAGTDKGPPFIHKVYEPSHHADFAWVRAVRGGVPAHHWPFGDMPAVEGVTDRQIEWIVTYVRELQRANGIE